VRSIGKDHCYGHGTIVTLPRRTTQHNMAAATTTTVISVVASCHREHRRYQQNGETEEKYLFPFHLFLLSKKFMFTARADNIPIME
jgi:hypothetical protein